MGKEKHDYAVLGLKAGLEIHQQLDTPKLFSGAPSYLRSDEPDYVVKRKLHAVAGESGEVDVAVAHEATLNKELYYQGYNDSITLVELDEEPPRPINEGALAIALQIALLLHCDIYPITQVMRKTVIDGSNTSGFQRTVLLAHGGYVETSFGKVPVESVAIEEDSARIIARDETSATYRLDRLGIPLVEIATAPAMKHPEQIKECALKIGEILRACKVKRGIGTIRQDVNVSITGHDRVEIKGFQDPKMMIATVDIEIDRQLAGVAEKDTNGAVRNALPSGETEFLRPLPGKARMYPETDLPLLKISKKRLDALKKDLPRLRSDIRDELRKKGLSDELITLVLSTDGAIDEFHSLMNAYDKDANLVAKMITLWRNELATKLKQDIDTIKTVLTEEMLIRVLETVKGGALDAGDVRSVLTQLAEGDDFETAVEVEKADDDEIEEAIRKIISEKPGLRPNAYMGLVMAQFKGKIDAKKAMQLIQRVLNE